MPKVSVAAAEQILKARQNFSKKRVAMFLPELPFLCREIRAVKLTRKSPKCLLLCGGEHGHKNLCEDIGGGVWWVRLKKEKAK